MRLVIVSGLSGSGKSVAINTLEDNDFYCIDNMPLSMMPICIEQFTAASPNLYERIAIGVDARSVSQDIHAFPNIIKQFKQQDIDFELVYLEASEEALIQRYRETGRKHPFTKNGLPLIDAIHAEKQILAEVILLADIYIDTTFTNVRQLRSIITDQVCRNKSAALTLLLQSFGFKYSVPNDSNYVFDVRFLPNPYWEQHLRSLAGYHPEVIDYLQSHEEVKQMISSIGDFIEYWIPHFSRESRNYLSVSIGCTGGQHRSVHIAEFLADRFRKPADRHVLVRHRDLKY